jgi:DNA-binding HxlR family transcriptional regulator
VELGLRNVQFRRQVPVKVEYKGHRVGESCLDLLVSDRVRRAQGRRGAGTDSLGPWD